MLWAGAFFSLREVDFNVIYLYSATLDMHAPLKATNLLFVSTLLGFINLIVFGMCHCFCSLKFNSLCCFQLTPGTTIHGRNLCLGPLRTLEECLCSKYVQT